MSDTAGKARKSITLHEITLLGAMLLVASAVVAFHVSPLWQWSHLIWFTPMMAGLAIVAFLNASLLLGYRNAFVFLLLGATIGYAAEQFGIWTGLVFGPYRYTDKLGFKLIDVPWVIPLCWFAIVYFAHVLTNVIVHTHPVARARDVFILAAVTALVATGFDVAMDPAMSHPEIQAWVWLTGGDYMGVPFKNFQGWFLTAFLIDLLYRGYAMREGIQPIGTRYRLATLTMLVVWGALGFGYMLIGLPVATQLIAVFTIMLPALLGLVSLYLRAWNP
jgi:uncharacterized membrane protein